MALPKITELVTYINKALTGNDWNTNWQKIVNWLSLGDTDIKVKSVETESLTNNGELTQNGDVYIDGDIEADVVTANSFVGDGSQLTNIQTESKFNYMPFTVNSAPTSFIDISDNTKLHFNIDENNPLIVTTAKGKTLTITSLIDYDVSGISTDGDYYIFVDEQSNGGSVYHKSCTIYRQQSTPSGSNGDLWFNTYNQPYIVREKVSGNWTTTEYDKVPIAIVTISGGTATDVKLMLHNVNGVDVAFDGRYISTDRERPKIVVHQVNSSNIWCRVWSDGWVEQGGETTMGTTITLYVAYEDTKYGVVATRVENNADESIFIHNKTTTSFMISGENAGTVDWYACGFRG